MAQQNPAQAATKARKILGSAGITHTVGTGRNDSGDPVVVVDVPHGVDMQSVRNKLKSLDAPVIVRHVKRAIIAQ